MGSVAVGGLGHSGACAASVYRAQGESLPPTLRLDSAMTFQDTAYPALSCGPETGQQRGDPIMRCCMIETAPEQSKVTQRLRGHLLDLGSAVKGQCGSQQRQALTA